MHSDGDDAADHEICPAIESNQTLGDPLEALQPDPCIRPYWRPTPAPTHCDWRLQLRRDAAGKVTPGGILVVAFAGLGVSDAPAFEFGAALARYPQIHQLFLRDSNLQWYVPNREWYASVVRAAAEASGASKLVFLGASAGGWGALLLQARFFPEAYVAAFSAQAFLDTDTRLDEEDDRWAPYVNHLNKVVAIKASSGGSSGVAGNGEVEAAGALLNLLQSPRLARVPPSSRHQPPRLEAHYNVHHYLDARHAAHLRRLAFSPTRRSSPTPPQSSNVGDKEDGEDEDDEEAVLRVRCVPHDGPAGDEAHALAKHLRDRGVLDHILDAFLLESHRDDSNTGGKSGGSSLIAVDATAPLFAPFAAAAPTAGAFAGAVAGAATCHSDSDSDQAEESERIAVYEKAALDLEAADVARVSALLLQSYMETRPTNHQAYAAWKNDVMEELTGTRNMLINEAWQQNSVLWQCLKEEPVVAAAPCAEATPLFDYLEVGGLPVPRFDLDLLRTVLTGRPSRSPSTSRSMSSNRHSTQGQGIGEGTGNAQSDDALCLRPALPSAALAAARYALTEVGFFLLRPSTSKSDIVHLRNDQHRNTRPGFPRATAQRVAECYAQCAAMAAAPLAQKQGSWSLEAALKQGLLGGWRRGETALIHCDSFRCAVEDLSIAAKHCSGNSGRCDNDLPATGPALTDPKKGSAAAAAAAAASAAPVEPTVAPSAADVMAAAAAGCGGCLSKRHLWPEEDALPGFKAALHGYAQALSEDAAPAVMGLLEEALCLPRAYLSSQCSPGNALSYLTTRVYPPDDSEAGTLGMRMQ
jgi:hypothetical protein